MSHQPETLEKDAKLDIEHIERKQTHDAASSFEDQPDVDPAFERKVIRKVDIRLLPVLGALYSVALIDRSNVALARVAGMGKDLQLTVGERYSIISLIFFVPYILLELPSNLILRPVGAARWLGSIALLWGAVTIGMGFVNTWIQLLVCRFLLGVLEAGFFPGCAFVISCWYKRYEVGKRMSAFYLISNFIAGFSAILAYGCSTLEGTAGLRGWRWIFIIEGIITCVFALMAYWFIVDFPDKAAQNKFLNQEELDLIKNRINKDRGDAEFEKLTWPLFIKHIVDPKIWAFALLFMGGTMPSYALAYFVPTILGTLGYSNRDSQILSAPPYVVAVPIAFTGAYLSDKFHNRSIVICFNAVMCLVGLVLVGYHTVGSVRYFGVFLGLAGAQANVPATLAWMNNSVVGASKRSVASALVIGFGGVGGIFATTVFRQKDFPRYRPGILAVVACQIMIIVISAMLVVHFHFANKKARAGIRLINNTPGFLYTL